MVILKRTPVTTKTYSKKTAQITPPNHQRSFSDSIHLPSSVVPSSQPESEKFESNKSKDTDSDDNKEEDDSDFDSEEEKSVEEEVVVQVSPTPSIKHPLRLPSTKPTKPIGDSPRKRKTSRSKQTDSDESYSPTKKPRQTPKPKPLANKDLLNTLVQQISALSEQVSQLQQQQSTDPKPTSNQSHSRPSSRTSSRTTINYHQPQEEPTSMLPPSRSPSRASSHSRHFRSNSIRSEDPTTHHPIPTRQFLQPSPTISFVTGIPNSFAQFPIPGPFTGTSSITSNSLLHYWPWVETAHLSAIASGTFDINQLSKLLRDEDARHKHFKETVDSVLTDLHSGKQKLVFGDSKLLSSLPNIQTFMSAFTIYTAIRSAYNREYGPALTAWMEQIYYHATYTLWPNVLKYTVNFFRTHETDPPETWLSFDNHLTSVHFTHGNTNNPPQTTSTSSANTSSSTSNPNFRKHRESSKDSSSRSRSPQKSSISFHLQTCIKFNKDKCSANKPCG